MEIGRLGSGVQLNPGDPITLGQLEQLFRAREQHLRIRIIAGRIPPALRSVISVEDVLQEAWVDLCRERETFRYRGEQAMHSWLDEVVEHTLYDMFRYARRKKRCGTRQRRAEATSFLSRFLAIPAAQASPSSELAARERTVQVRDALQSLPEQEKAAVQIVCETRASKRQLAHSMDQSEASFRSLFSRARQRLRRLLARTQKEQDHP